MKKLIAIILAVMLAATATVGVSAGTVRHIVDQISNPPSAATSLTYEVDPTYTVTIPAIVTLGSSVIVAAEDVIVDEGKQVTVKLTATSGTANAFTLSNGSTGTIGYAVKKGSTAIAINDTVLAVDPSTSATGSTALTFENTTPVPKFAGTYTGTVTFTVAVENK